MVNVRFGKIEYRMKNDFKHCFELIIGRINYLAFPPPIPTSSASHLTFPTSCSCIRLMHNDKSVNLKNMQIRYFHKCIYRSVIIWKNTDNFQFYFSNVPKYAVQKNKWHLNPSKESFSFVCIKWLFGNHVSKPNCSQGYETEIDWCSKCPIFSLPLSK